MPEMTLYPLPSTPFSVHGLLRHYPTGASQTVCRDTQRFVNKPAHLRLFIFIQLKL